MKVESRHRARLGAALAGGMIACAGMAGCGGSVVTSVPEGIWGGSHLGLVVASTGADVVLDCAHGAITVPLLLEADGSFRLPGYLVHDVGPAHIPEDRLPATYNGSWNGSSITLAFTVPDTGEARGPFEALPGEAAQVYECR